MRITQLARREGIPDSTARDAARRVGVESGRDITDSEWSAIKAAITRTNQTPRPVVKMSLDGGAIERFDSVMSAAKSVDVYPNGIRVACEDPHRTCAGFRWKYES